MRCGFTALLFLLAKLTPTSVQADNDLALVDCRFDGLRFDGNLTAPDHFKLLHLDSNHLLIGARDSVYNISVRDFSVQQLIAWPSSSSEIQLCQMKGNEREACHNYIRVLAKSNDTVLICGTNAFKPTCRLYSQNSAGRYVVQEELVGNGISPYDPTHNSSAVFLGERDEIYAGTVADFAGTDPLIYRRNIRRKGDFGIRTERSDIKCLNDPNFVGAFQDDGLVYFWFREEAVEYTNCGKAVYSRVARVCTEDKGGPRAHEDTWTSFLKARLNCSIPGDYPFYFDEIEAISNTVHGQYGEEHARLVYAVFNTPFAAIRGSAICAFSVDAIRNLFAESPFKSQTSPNANWQQVLKTEIPEPRPGSCSTDSRHMSDEAVSFIKSNPLMDEAVSNFFPEPLLIQIGLKDRLTQVAVDPSLVALDGNRFDVLFVGTDSGKVLKIVNLAGSSAASSMKQAIIIETMEIFDDQSPVRNLIISRSSEPKREGLGHLVVVSDHQVRRLPLHHCGRAISCGDCTKLRDPYCAWNLQKDKCVAKFPGKWPAGSYLQSVLTGRAACPYTAERPIKEVLVVSETQEAQQSLKPVSSLRPTPTTEIRNSPKSKSSVQGAKEDNCNCDSPNAEPRAPTVKKSIQKTSELGTEEAAVERKPTAEADAYSAKSLAIAVICSLLLAFLLGFISGFQCSHKNCLRRKKELLRTPSALSRTNQNGFAPSAKGDHLKRTPSKLAHINAYESTPKYNGTNDFAESQVSHVLDLDEHSKSSENNLIVLNNSFNTNTLPKDYKVKKMYL